MSAFVAWMVLWPAVCDFGRSYRIKVTGKEETGWPVFFWLWFELFVWVMVATLVYPGVGAS